jgi:hypothetical protein
MPIVYGELVDKSKLLVNQLLDKAPTPEGEKYDHYFHTSDYVLHVQFSGDLIRIPDFVIMLDKKTSGWTGSEIKPCLQRMMNFRRRVADKEMTLLGHGDLSEVVTALEGMLTKYTEGEAK